MASEPEAMPKLSPARPYSRLSLRFQFNLLRPKARPSSSPDFSSGLNLGEVGPLLGVWQIMGQAHVQATLTIPLRPCLQLFIAA